MTTATTPSATWPCPKCGGALSSLNPQCGCDFFQQMRESAARRRRVVLQAAGLSPTEDGRNALIGIKTRHIMTLLREAGIENFGIEDANPYKVT